MDDMLARSDLVDRLVADLKPVRRLAPVPMRALGWLAVVLAIGLLLALDADFDDIRHRLIDVPDMWLAVTGSALTTLLATLAAFELALPDRSRLWALVPLPGVALWLGGSGLGCARTWLIPGEHDFSLVGNISCLYFIIGLSVPLSLVMIMMLRRGYSLSPTLAGAIAGLAVASAAATLLDFFHPYDAALDDVVVHILAVLIVVAANRVVGGRIIRRSTGNLYRTA